MTSSTPSSSSSSLLQLFYPSSNIIPTDDNYETHSSREQLQVEYRCQQCFQSLLQQQLNDNDDDATQQTTYSDSDIQQQQHTITTSTSLTTLLTKQPHLQRDAHIEYITTGLFNTLSHHYISLDASHFELSKDISS